MGLLIDRVGIPLDFELFAGNVTDMQIMLPVVKKAKLRSKDALEANRVVMVADKGFNTFLNIAACILDGNGFVFSQSVRKATKALKRWVPNESGTFKIKERTSKKAVWVEAEDGLRNVYGRVRITEVAEQKFRV